MRSTLGITLLLLLSSTTAFAQESLWTKRLIDSAHAGSVVPVPGGGFQVAVTRERRTAVPLRSALMHMTDDGRVTMHTELDTLNLWSHKLLPRAENGYYHVGRIINPNAPHTGTVHVAAVASNSPIAPVRIGDGTSLLSTNGIRLSNDGGVIVAASRSTTSQDVLYGFRIAKLDTNLAVQWDHNYDSLTARGSVATRELADGSVVVLGACSSTVGITKLSASGEMVWSRCMDADSAYVGPVDVEARADGGFVVLGSYYTGIAQYSPVLYWLDAAGNVERRTLYRGEGRPIQIERSGAGYLVSLDRGINVLMRVDGSGSVAWRVRYVPSEHDFAQPNHFALLDDGRIALVGDALDGIVVVWLLRETPAAIEWMHGVPLMMDLW